ncbi:hypothetical protein A374_09708 [Fictibacillus macauensis ZFHKF-1]|uniref:Uncharacterized protein n=1 Tax=Fictibacillus macauensis ZFHKF-1 TaxID=1196324 RepID=I8UFC6_9BACL|nr:hypothetical protein [Fictibacillus macauensis]EIT85503.1 hypothetical protein A374_09708 [Fictibacillus macauensis ZFHKF-1]
MKKKLVAILSAMMVILSFAPFAFAADGDQAMKAAMEKGLKDKYYDLKSGSLSIESAKTFSNEDAKLETDSVVAMVVSYQTVRDGIFYTDHKELGFYDPKGNKMLAEQQVAKANPALLQYKKAHEGELGSTMHYTAILLLLALVLLIPLYLLGIWEKGQYLTTKFKIKNNVYNHTKMYQ